MNTKLSALFPTIFTAVALTGCAGHSDLMANAPVGAPAPAPTPNVATVVFVRDSGMGFAVNFSVMNQSGQLLGEAVAKSHFAVQVPPGHYWFGAKAESTSAIQADVLGGRLYYVRVVPKFGMWTARVDLDPIKPSEKEWGEVPTWLKRTQYLVPSFPVAPVSGPGTDAVAPWVARAWGSMSAEEQAAHSLVPSDGWSLPDTSASPVALAK
jgi:hypothetical protein